MKISSKAFKKLDYIWDDVVNGEDPKYTLGRLIEWLVDNVEVSEDEHTTK